VDSAFYFNVGNLVFVQLLQLLQDFTAMLLFGFGSDCPMLGSVEGVKAWNLAYYDLVG
jgi:hypothetical protein